LKWRTSAETAATGSCGSVCTPQTSSILFPSATMCLFFRSISKSVDWIRSGIGSSQWS
jgi:hypothetical protein